MSRRTGTGYIGSTITAMYLSSNDIFNSVILGTIVMGIIGEKDSNNIIGKKIELCHIFIEMINELYNLAEEDIVENIKAYRLDI